METLASEREPQIYTDPETKLAQTVGKLMAPTPEMVVQFAPEIDAITQEVLNTSITDKERREVMAVGEVVRWYCLGQPGDPLPDSLAYMRVPASIFGYDNESGNKTRLGIFRSGQLDPISRATLQRFYNQGLGYVQTDMNNMLQDEARASKIKAAAETYLEESPLVNFLRALEGPQEDEQQPLNQYWRRIAERQEEALIRKQFGMNEDEQFIAGTPARQRLQKKLQDIDERTMRAPEATVDPAERFKQLLVGAINARASQQGGLYTVSDVSYADSFRINLHTSVVVDGKTEQQTLTLNAYEAATQLLDGLGFDDGLGNAGEVRVLKLSFLRAAILNVLVPYRPYGYARALDEAMPEAIDRFTTEVLFERLQMGTDPRHLYSKAWLLQSPGEFIAQYGYTLEQSHDSHWQAHVPYIQSREKSEQAKGIMVGSIVTDDRKRQTPSGAPRLVLFDSYDPAKLTGEKPSLVINISSYRPDQMPSIPGFRIVSHDSETGNYGFVREPENDPYALCDVPLPTNELGLLAQSFSAKDFPELGTALSSGNIKTVEDLRRLLQSFSSYTYDQQYDRFHPLDNHKSFLKDGKLQLQCTGAAALLKHCLSELFDEPASYSLAEGLTLPITGSYIDAQGHQQVVFSDGQRTYILDSTPTEIQVSQRRGLSLRNVGQSIRAAKANKKQAASPTLSAPVVEDAVKIEEELRDRSNTVEASGKVVVPTEIGYLYPGRELARLRAEVEQAVIHHLGVVNSEQMYRVAVKLGSNDPIRRALAVAMRPLSDTTAQEAVDAVNYLELVARADKATLRRLGIAQDAHITKTVLNPLRLIQKLGERYNA